MPQNSQALLHVVGIVGSDHAAFVGNLKKKNSCELLKIDGLQRGKWGCNRHCCVVKTSKGVYKL